MTLGAAAFGILTLVVAIMMVAARPHARSAESADAAARTASASTALIEEATAPAPEAPVAVDEKSVGIVTAPVSITGCLERADERFRLKDTEGEDAPRTRSWKSGFLKKSPASIQVVDASNRLGLTRHVGERVTVTGTLIDREMRVRSLQRVAASCGPKTRV
jgi:hypothetical protein